MKSRRRPRVPPRPWVAAGVVFAIGLAVYLPTIDYGFTYDDHHHFVRNTFVQDLSNLRLMAPWSYLDREIPDQGRPVFVLSQFLDRALGGGAGVCHLQSALWHALTAALVFFLALSLELGVFAAGAAGVLFALHPLDVEAVAGISNREDVLATFFVLLGLLAARRVLAGRRSWLVALGASQAFALGAKESALALPLYLALLAFCSPSFRPARSAKRVWLGVALALGLVLAGWGAFQLRLGAPSLAPLSGGTSLEHAQTTVAPMPLVRSLMAARSPDSTEPDVPPTPRRKPYGEVRLHHGIALEAFRAWQLVVPWPTSPEYDLSPFRSGLAALGGSAVLGLLIWLALADARRKRRITLAIGWFFAATLPVAFPTLLLNPLADRYLYSAVVGVAILLGWALGHALPSRSSRPNAAGWAVTAVALAYFVVTMLDLGAWHDDVSLFRKAARYAPNSARVQLNLGSALLDADELDAALPALRRAVTLDPELLAAHYDLGVLEERRGHPRVAIEHYATALSVNAIVGEMPLRDRACGRLAALLASERNSARARSLYEAESRKRGKGACAAGLARAIEPRP